MRGKFALGTGAPTIRNGVRPFAAVGRPGFVAGFAPETDS